MVLFKLLPANGIFLGRGGHRNLLFPIEITMLATWMQRSKPGYDLVKGPWESGSY
jgi:hypothetical protein